MEKQLRIAMLTGIKRSINPGVTAARNRVIVDLATELVSRGHDVTLYTTQDSSLPGVHIEPILPSGLTALPAAENPFYQHTAYLTKMIATLISKQDSYDVVHNHMYPEYLPLLALDAMRIPTITTFHAQMTPESTEVLGMFPSATVVAISDAASRASGRGLPVVHNGIDTDLFVPDDTRKHEYALFVGRMSKAKGNDGAFLDPKGVTNAIAVCEKLRMPLKIVGNIEDPEFFEMLIKPHLSDTIQLVGGGGKEQNLTREDVVALYQGARVFLNPINWEEPFGLVMAEAMSCGVPVVAYDRGSVSELVADGKTGFVVDPQRGHDGLIEALGAVDSIDRHACRSHAVERFSKARMTSDYLDWYQKLLQS